MNHQKANLFIIGAMKAGTTSFCDMLSTHTQVYFAPIKEPHFFVESLPKKVYDPSKFFNLDAYFENEFPNKLHIAQIQRPEHYQKLFSLAPANSTYLAEGSTCYIHAPEAPTKIHQYNPDAKVILITRDPLKRAYSQYNMDVGLGRTLQSFEEILMAEIKDYHNKQLSTWSYLGMSQYAPGIEKYKNLFGDNFLVLSFEGLINNKEESLKKLSLFLNIDTQNLVLPNQNNSSELKHKKLFYKLKQAGLKDYFSKWVPHSLKMKIFKAFTKPVSKEIPLSQKVKEELNSIFAVDAYEMKKYL